MSAVERTHVFVSYSHADRVWLDRLQIHLAPLVSQRLVDAWDDTKIRPGSQWQSELEDALFRAHIAVLLISADFLASDSIMNKELPLLLERSARGELRLLPVVVGPSRWETIPALYQLKSLNPPDRPLTAMLLAEAEETLARLAHEITDHARASRVGGPEGASVVSSNAASTIVSSHANAHVEELASAVRALTGSAGAQPRLAAARTRETLEEQPTSQLLRERELAAEPAEPDTGASRGSQWGIDFNAIIRLPMHDPWRWTIVLSRDEASRHGDLMMALRRKQGQTEPRFIESGFAYWGIGPTIQWRRACQDSFYAVMRKGIDTFQARWTELVRKFGQGLPRVYVSYGVGTGEKDHTILRTMIAAPDAPVYVPTDMSLDMLMNGAKAASKGVLDPSRLIPLQIDFSSATELVTLSEIRRDVLGDKPALFSLLGNTLANFENDVVTLKTLAELIKEGDLMLIELAATKTVDEAVASMASSEYSSIPSFESFVRSALTQHTDLPPNRIDYHCEACHDGGALQIDMDYVSTNRSRGRLIDGSMIDLRPNERIRLYRSRKYTHAVIKRMLAQAGLTEIAVHLQWNERNSPFGLYLGICGR